MLITSALMINDDKDANQEGTEVLNAENTCDNRATAFAKHHERVLGTEETTVARQTTVGSKTEGSETLTRSKTKSRQAIVTRAGRPKADEGSRSS